MPIKKRGGGSVKIKKKRTPVTKKTEKKKEFRQPKSWVGGKPNIKKRRRNTSEYVYTDEGLLIVKTPARCTNWPNEFRKLIVNSYIPPRTFRAKGDVKLGHEEHYLVEKNRVSVTYRCEDANPGVVVLSTQVNNLTTGKTMFLNHSDPAMRILMVYVFLTGSEIGGVPKLSIEDITT